MNVCVHAHVCLQVSMHLGMRVGGQPQGPSCLHHSGVVIKHALPRLAFSGGGWGSKLRSLCLQALQQQPSPQNPQILFPPFQRISPTGVVFSLFTVHGKAVVHPIQSCCYGCQQPRAHADLIILLSVLLGAAVRGLVEPILHHRGRLCVG